MDGEEEEKKEEEEEEETWEKRKEKKEEEKEEEEKSDKMVKLWRSGRFQRDYTINNPSVTCGSFGKVAGSDVQEFQ